MVIKTEKRCILCTLIHTLWRNKYCVYINGVQSGSEVKKRNNMCSDIFRHKQQKEHIKIFLQQSSNLCDRCRPELLCRTVTRLSWKRTRPVASRSMGRGKEVEDCGLWKYPRKKVFNYLQAINDEAFPLSKVYCISCSILKCSKVQFLATCSPACVSHGQSIICNWGKWRPCDMSHLCIITNTSNCSVLPYHR